MHPHARRAANLTEAVRLAEELGDRVTQSVALLNLGLVLIHAGDLDAARDSILDGTDIARQMDAIPEIIQSIETAAFWLDASGDPRQAIKLQAAADTIRVDENMPMTADDAELFDPSLRRERSTLTPAQRDAATMAGRGLRLKDALATAISALQSRRLDVRIVAARRERNRHDLTPRELEVAALVAAGRSDGEIAEALFISKKTASVHVANIKDKLGVGNRVEIALRAGAHDLAGQPRPS